MIRERGLLLLLALLVPTSAHALQGCYVLTEDPALCFNGPISCSNNSADDLDNHGVTFGTMCSQLAFVNVEKTELQQSITACYDLYSSVVGQINTEQIELVALKNDNQALTTQLGLATTTIKKLRRRITKLKGK